MYLVLMALCSYIHKYTHLHHCLQFFLYLCGLLLKGPTTRQRWILSKYCFRRGAGTPRSTPQQPHWGLWKQLTKTPRCVWRTGPSPHRHHVKLHAHTRESSLWQKSCTRTAGCVQQTQTTCSECNAGSWSALDFLPSVQHHNMSTTKSDGFISISSA